MRNRSAGLRAVLSLLSLLFFAQACDSMKSSSSSSSVNVAPRLAVTSPSTGTVVPGYSTLTGACDSGSTIQLSGDSSGSVACANDGTFTVSFRLTDGQGNKTVHVMATDTAGNSSRQDIALVMPAPTLKGANLFEPCDNYYGQYYMPTNEPNIQWDLDYYKSKGLTLIRLGIGWEYTQPTLNGALTPWVVSCLHYVINQAATRDIKVILDLHNYARYVINNNSGQVDASTAPAGDIKLLGSTDVPDTAFADFWTKMATEFGGATNIYAYGLMNEPHDMPSTTQWPTSAQTAVTAIRTVDTTTPILVSGDGWSAAYNWATINSGLSITDPANKIVYEAHVYFDPYGAGQYTATYAADAAYSTLGIDQARPFVDWLNQHHYKGLFGEFGVPTSDSRWLTVLDNFMNYAASNSVDMTAWSGGFMWDQFGQRSDWFNLEPAGASSLPANPIDQLQMSVVQKYPSTH